MRCLFICFFKIPGVINVRFKAFSNFKDFFILGKSFDYIRYGLKSLSYFPSMEYFVRILAIRCHLKDCFSVTPISISLPTWKAYLGRPSSDFLSPPGVCNLSCFCNSFIIPPALRSAGWTTRQAACF